MFESSVQKPPGAPGGIEHFNFIERTDRRNLRTQLKNLVVLAQDIATRDLNKRREKLRKLIEYEDKMFEEEFARSAKARLQSEIKKPVSTSEKDAQKMLEFLEKKRVQQYMNCCYEVREALREKARQENKICLEEQILENERKMARQRELDRYWLKVQEINLERQDERDMHEACIAEWRRDKVNHVLSVQLEEKEAKLAEERKEKAADVERINALLRELELEELNRTQTDSYQKSLEYRKELEAMIEAKKRERVEEQRQLVKEHCELMDEIATEEEMERKRIALAKQAHKKALLDFIDYVQGMRKMEADMEKMRDDRFEDLYRVDICTKRNIAEVARKRAEKAQECYCVLRKQICEQLERQRIEEIERREDKIIENRFARPEAPRSIIIAKRVQHRLDLDKQIEETKRVRALEEAEYEKRLLRAIDDPEICRQLAEEYMRDNVDYLDPHPNWLILLDPCKQYMPKGEGTRPTPPINVEKLLRRHPKEPLLPVMTCAPYKPTGPCSKLCDQVRKKASSEVEKPCDDKCIIPCGCAKRWKLPC